MNLSVRVWESDSDMFIIIMAIPIMISHNNNNDQKKKLLSHSVSHSLLLWLYFTLHYLLIITYSQFYSFWPYPWTSSFWNSIISASDMSSWDERSLMICIICSMNQLMKWEQFFTKIIFQIHMKLLDSFKIITWTDPLWYIDLNACCSLGTHGIASSLSGIIGVLSAR